MEPRGKKPFGPLLFPQKVCAIPSVNSAKTVDESQRICFPAQLQIVICPSANGKV